MVIFFSKYTQLIYRHSESKGLAIFAPDSAYSRIHAGKIIHVIYSATALLHMIYQVSWLEFQAMWSINLLTVIGLLVCRLNFFVIAASKDNNDSQSDKIELFNLSDLFPCYGYECMAYKIAHSVPYFF